MVSSSEKIYNYVVVFAKSHYLCMLTNFLVYSSNGDNNINKET